MLFGERVLAGEIYANKLNQIRNESIKNEHNIVTHDLEPIVAELEETKQSLEKAREESLAMASCLSSLAEELEMAKMELKQLKAREPAVERVVEPEVEDVKFVENADTEFEMMKAEAPMVEQGIIGLEKKRSVKFANPPTLVRTINPEEQRVLHRQSFVEREAGQVKKKKNKLIPMLSAIFSKKKGYNQDGILPEARSSRAQGF